MNRRFFLTGSAVATAAAGFPAVARACAVCLTGAGNDPVVNAFNWSVLFLMATPYVVVGSIAGWLFYHYRRAAAQRKAVERDEPAGQLAWTSKESGR